MTPDASNYNPDPQYLWSLMERTGKPLREVARLIGVNRGTLKGWLAPDKPESQAPYPVQFCLEALANTNQTKVSAS